VQRRIWFHRTCSMIWILLLIPAWFWWRDSVFFVITASIYANVKSDWAASEAADDRLVMAALDDIKQQLEQWEAGHGSVES
jgi:hypothetical protein